MTPQAIADRLADICSDIVFTNPSTADLNNCNLPSLGLFISAYDSLIAPTLSQLADCPDAAAYYDSLQPFLNSVTILSVTIAAARISIRILHSIFSEI